ncbi:MAG: tetratricopeptide repeat protein [Magnetococcales bacterium]|nr:tetratricopeptide repeat protein [Magnetococcales bacterium]
MDTNKHSHPSTIKQNSNSADYHFSLAVDHYNGQRFTEAEKLCVTIAQSVPNHVNAINLLGVIAQKLDRHDLAVEHFQRVINIDSSGWEIYYNLGVSLNYIGRVAEALEVLIIAMQKNPGNQEVTAFTHSIIEKTILNSEYKSLQDRVDRYLNHGLLMHQNGHFKAALSWYDRVIALQPDNHDALGNAGVILQSEGRLSEAITRYQEAIAVKPNYAEAYSNLATALQEDDRLEEALINCQKAISLKTDFASAHNNLANILQEQGDYKASIIQYQKAVAINHCFADAFHNLSLNQLLIEDFTNGFKNYHWRWQINNFDTVSYNKYENKLWQGEQLDNKRVLVWAEQGIGESIIYFNLLNELIKRGAELTFECDKRLIPIFSRSLTAISFVAKHGHGNVNSQNEDYDYIVPLGNICRWLLPDITAIPDRSPHLFANSNKRDAIRKKYLAKGNKMLVGVAWYSKSNKFKYKSMSLFDLLPILKTPGITFVDLQYGDTSSQRADFTAKTGIDIYHDESIDQMSDLDGFAAQVAAMDHVITVSNSTVHMAGGLGVPTFLMLGLCHLWYWFLDRKETPWYKTVLLFRQKEGGEWGDVIKEAGNELNEIYKL